jgi:KDO2-lipid IV(A) lauroyltransferase
MSAMSSSGTHKRLPAGKRFRHWLLRTRLLAALVKALAYAIAWMPLALSRALGRLAGSLACVADRKHRRIGLANLALAFPETSAAQRRALLRACYRHMGVCAVEFCRFLRVTAEDIRRRWVAPEPGAEECVRAALAEGRGVIAVSGHVGFWELSGLAYPAFGFPLLSITREAPAPRIEELIMRIRGRLGNRLVYQRHALFHLLRALRQKKVVGLHMDQYAGRQGTYVPFFGREASSVDTCARLHVMTGAPLVSTFMQRRPDGRYAWRCRRMEVPPPAAGQTEEARIRQVLELCNRELETAIRQAPEQWLWIHNRWRDHRRQGLGSRV